MYSTAQVSVALALEMGITDEMLVGEIGRPGGGMGHLYFECSCEKTYMSVKTIASLKMDRSRRRFLEQTERKQSMRYACTHSVCLVRCFF
jgi:hypothetical protein